jgi:organic radical activating enzyme
VKEIYYTLQGEGANTGRPAVFCRFAGGNLWSGRESDRPDTICRVCDTDFVGTDGPGGGRFTTPNHLAATIAGLWPVPSSDAERGFVVLTGGEPLLQVEKDSPFNTMAAERCTPEGDWARTKCGTSGQFGRWLEGVVDAPESGRAA